MTIVDRVGRVRVELVTGYAVQAFGTALGVLLALWLLVSVALGTGVIVGLVATWVS